MAYTIAFFGTKPYDETSFNEKNKEFGFELRFFKGHLNRHNVLLTQGVDAVCIFVNDTADAEVIRTMAANGVKLIAPEVFTSGKVLRTVKLRMVIRLWSVREWLFR